VAIEYGATENHLRVGIDVDVEVNTATYQRVKFLFYADPEPDGWGWNDDMAMKISGHAGTSTVNFHKNANNNQLVATRTVTRDKGSGSSNIVVSCTISGAFNGATPSASRTHVVPAKAIGVPEPPALGTLEVLDTWDSGATLQCGTSRDSNGAAVDDYHFQVASGSSFSGNVVYSDIDGSRRRVVGGLGPGRTYWFRVRCHNSQGWGNFGVSKAFNTDIRVPDRILGRNNTGTFATLSTLNWGVPFNGGDDLIQYQVRYRPVGGSFTVREVWAQDQSFYQATGLNPGTNYEWQVRASNSAGWGPWQDDFATFTTSSLWPDSPPRPTVSNIGLTDGRVNWSAPDARGSTITGYQVQWSVNSGFSGATTSPTQSASARSYTITGLSAGTRYYVRVRALSNEGNGNWSPSRSFATTGLTIPYPIVREWTGSGWRRLDPVNIWDGTDWTEISDVKYWNGTTWVDVAQEPY
jgi:hypothetical protein